MVKHLIHHVTHRNGSPHESSLDESLSLCEQVKNLEELADYRKQLLDDSEWRYHQLIEQLNLSQEVNLGLIRALPPATAEASSPEPVMVIGEPASPEPLARRRCCGPSREPEPLGRLDKLRMILGSGWNFLADLYLVIG